MTRELTDFHRILARAVLVLAACFFSLLIAEGIIRLVRPQGVSVPWQDEVNGIVAPRPGVRGRHAVPNTFDVTVSFNSQRFRGRRDYQLEPPLGGIRIATLGDSFTLGYGANDDETYPAQLERILRQRLARSGPQLVAEVINAGNINTGTGEQALWFDIWVKQFHPHVVILTVVANDVEDDLDRGLFVLDEKGRASPRSLQELVAAGRRLRLIRQAVNSFPGYSFLAQHSQLLSFLRIEFPRLLTGRTEPAPKTTMARQREALAVQYHEKGLPMMAAEVSWLRKQVQSAGGRLVVVFVPFRESIYSSQAPWADDIRWKSEAIVETLRKECSQEAIPFKDLTSWMQAQALHLRQPLYYKGTELHPNPTGYRVIAEAIASFLIAEGMIPSASLNSSAVVTRGRSIV